MAPVGGKTKGKARSDGRSRNTTPISTASTEQVSSVSGGPSNMTYDELLDKYGGVNSPPGSNTLKTCLESLKAFSEVAKMRSEHCDKGMRELSKRINELRQRVRERELAAEREEEERKERAKRVKLLKKREEERPMAVGAHALARQDGVESTGPSEDIESTDIPMEQAKVDIPRSPASPTSSVSSHQPKPAPAIPQYQTFGPDPSAFDDPTIYHIRDIDDCMSEEEKKDILGVNVYPHDDLRHLTVGPLPDQNLENAKPSSQVTAHQFQTYIEPYTRPYTEEDIAFLKERGDRVGPFTIPRRGLRHYKEVWAEEDQSLVGESFQPTTEDLSINDASGNIEQMNDEMAETSAISLGPTTSRFLALMKPERRAPVGENFNTGETSAIDGDSRNDGKADEQQSQPLPPATFLPESFRFPSNVSVPRLDAGEMDERLLMELRNAGLLSEDAEPDYEGHFDDEVAARLRYLQEELTRVGQLNSARKARVLELMEEAAAKQEWSTIADDLDSQLNQAYLKRHRNIGKGKNKLKRPGGPGGGSHSISGGNSKPGLGESIRALMQRREEWSDIIGPVVDHGKTYIPRETIFDVDNMARLLAFEIEVWNDAQGSQ